MYDATLLTKVMGLPTTYSSAPITRSVRLLFKDRAAIEPYKERPKVVRPKNTGQSRGVQLMLKAINKHKTLTSQSASKVTEWQAGHCGILLAKLHELGLVNRRKEKGNHTRWYVYTKKETA